MEAKTTSDDNLSPVKIAVLILVYLYLYDELPNKRQIVPFIAKQLEGIPIVHNHKLVLLSTLRDFCDAIETSAQSRGSPRDILDEFKYKFLHVAWNITTADQIQQLGMDAFRKTADPLCVTSSGESQISARSPIGRFVRMMAASLKLLLFEESSGLVNGFSRFRSSTQDIYSDLCNLGFKLPRSLSVPPNPNTDPLFKTWDALQKVEFSKSRRPATQNVGDEATDERFYKALNSSLRDNSTFLPEMDDSTDALVGFTTTVTIPDMDLLVNEQVRLLECFGTPTPDFLRTIIHQMASPQSLYSSLPSLHYLQYLENLARGEYHEAFNSLHKYFDYMVSKGSKYFYHFALVSKASLHQLFGEDEEALDSMDEAISIARENRDNATLTYVLSWLYDFMRRKPSLWKSRIFRQVKNELRLLDYLVKKSLTVSLSLAAVSYRFEAEHLLNGRSPFSKYYESLFKAGYFAINDSISSFIGVCHTSARIWKYVGYPHLSQLYTSLGLHYSKEHGSVRDVLAFNMSEAWNQYYLGHSELMLPDMKLNLELCNSNLAHFKPLRILLLLRQVEVALGKGRVRFAEELLLYVPEGLELDQECLFERIRVEFLLKVAQGNSTEALLGVSAHISDMNKLRAGSRPDIIHMMELEFMKVGVLIQCGVPMRAFSLVLQQLALAKHMGLRYLVARGCLHLIQICNILEKPDEALAIARSVLALIDSVGNVELLSNTFFELASSHQQLLDSNSKDDNGSREMSKTNTFAHFLNFLSLSIAGYKKSVNLGMLVNSFELEDRMAQTALKHAEIRDSKPFEDFRKHSQMGLDILRRRAYDECDYGYLRQR